MCFIAKSCTASVSMSVPTSPVAQRSHARARLNSATPLHSLPRQQFNRADAGMHLAASPPQTVAHD